ncbi:Protein NUCLEAR FUSION DEFECTIVE 4 [Linum grandiflorum]
MAGPSNRNLDPSNLRQQLHVRQLLPLKSLMNLNQLQLNNLSVAKAFGLLAGLASDRFPTWVLLLISSIEGLIGYGVQWLVAVVVAVFLLVYAVQNQ